jgi:hypothetical protein
MVWHMVDVLFWLRILLMRGIILNVRPQKARRLTAKSGGMGAAHWW